MTDFHVQKLSIDGMHCDTCVQRVTKALGSLSGVRVNTVSVGEARVLAEPNCEPFIREALEKVGLTLKDMHGEG